MKTMVIAVVLILLISNCSSAQKAVENDTLVGLVVNVKGKGIKNVPVFISKQKEPVRTNRKGIFMYVGEQLPDSINILLPSKKIFRIPVSGKNFLKIMTGENSFSVTEAKDEIINIGYGSVQKSDQTSDSFSVSGDELRATGESDIIRAIAGKIPGLNLNYKDDGTVTIQIRGGTSLGSSNEPIYLVDGTVVNDLQFVNMNDIEKVDILKDGSIYGTRGANGAILVTTKK